MVYEVPLTNKKYKLVFTQTKDSICVQLFKKFNFWWGICDAFWFEYKDFTGIEGCLNPLTVKNVINLFKN